MKSSKIRKKIFSAKYKLFRRAGREYYRELLRNQHLSPDELHALNWQKRKRLIAYAYENVPFYKRKYSAAGLNPEDIKKESDFTAIPLLTKDELRVSFEEMVSVQANRKHLRVSTTGGSTGVPVKVFFDNRIPLETLGWRMLQWWGLEPYTDAAFVWRVGPRSALRRWKDRLKWWPTQRILMDASHMTQEIIDGFLKKFNRVRPGLLQGYVGAIAHLARYIEQRDRSVHSPEAVWLTSSPITLVQREQIEKAFMAPVYDQYGCCEVHWLSAQCGEKGALHRFHDVRHIEFIGDEGRPKPSGDMGRIVITDLENYLFPIIRYENGDLGRELPGTCRCGLTLPLMDKVGGRVTDLVTLPSGTSISGEFLTTLFDDFPSAVSSFQVAQKPDYSINVKYVPEMGEDELAPIVAKVKGKLAKATDSEVPIVLESVEEIAHDRGKLRFVISEVK